MRRGQLIVLAGACLLGVIMLLTLRSRPPEPLRPSKLEAPREGIPRTSKERTVPVTPSPDSPPSSSAPDAPHVSAGSTPPTVNTGLQPALDEPPAADRPQPIWPAPATRLESVRATIQQYGSAFNGNPVGTNAEITAALNGDNPRQTHFLNGADGNTINSKGELSDPWGSPYFFHQLSAREMEVRSAGPDRIMYTADDLIAR